MNAFPVSSQRLAVKAIDHTMPLLIVRHVVLSESVAFGTKMAAELNRFWRQACKIAQLVGICMQHAYSIHRSAILV